MLKAVLMHPEAFETCIQKHLKMKPEAFKSL